MESIKFLIFFHHFLSLFYFCFMSHSSLNIFCFIKKLFAFFSVEKLWNYKKDTILFHFIFPTRCDRAVWVAREKCHKRAQQWIFIYFFLFLLSQKKRIKFFCFSCSIFLAPTANYSKILVVRQWYIATTNFCCINGCVLVS